MDTQTEGLPALQIVASCPSDDGDEWTKPWATLLPEGILEIKLHDSLHDSLTVLPTPHTITQLMRGSSITFFFIFYLFIYNDLMQAQA